MAQGGSKSVVHSIQFPQVFPSEFKTFIMELLLFGSPSCQLSHSQPPDPALHH